MQSKQVFKPLSVIHWSELYDHKTQRLTACRPAGAPAGVFPHTPWWHCAFHDEYERINFWSHAVPAVCLLAVFCSRSEMDAVALFALAAMITHGCSALTHIWPDSHAIEKCDHVGITATIIGTPVSALMVKFEGHHLPMSLQIVSVWLLLSAFFPAKPRVLGFIGGGAVMMFMFGGMLMDLLFGIEMVLYLLGGALFLRNDGHSRGVGFSDHHFLHYFVTLATGLHFYYLLTRIDGG